MYVSFAPSWSIWSISASDRRLEAPFHEEHSDAITSAKLLDTVTGQAWVSRRIADCGAHSLGQIRYGLGTRRAPKEGSHGTTHTTIRVWGVALKGDPHNVRQGQIPLKKSAIASDGGG